MQTKIIDFFDYVPLSRIYEFKDRLKQNEKKQIKKALKQLKTPISKRTKHATIDC
jgi:hypothetical protein